MRVAAVDDVTALCAAAIKQEIQRLPKQRASGCGALQDVARPRVRIHLWVAGDAQRPGGGATSRREHGRRPRTKRVERVRVLRQRQIAVE